MVDRSHLRERFLPGNSAPTFTFGLEMIPKADAEKPELVALPCRYLRFRDFRFQPNHPSTEAAQIKAAAVREGCDWCPSLIDSAPSSM